MGDVAERGVIAAGHPLTAQAGARVLREGGNAVDATVGAMLTSFVTESLLTGLGAGGYMLVAGAGVEPTLLDFFVRGARRASATAPRRSCSAWACPSATPSRCSTSGRPRAACMACRRACARRRAGGARCSLEELAAPAAQLAREGVVLNAGQAYVAEILVDLLTSTPECAALWAPGGELLREGELLRNPELGDALLRLAREGAEPFYSGDVAAAVCDWLAERGGSLRASDLAGYEAVEREPVRMRLPRPRRSSPTRRRPPAARCSRTRSRCSIARPRRRRCARSSTRWPRRSPSARPSSSRGSTRRASSSASWPPAWAPRRTSR